MTDPAVKRLADALGQTASPDDLTPDDLEPVFAALLALAPEARAHATLAVVAFVELVGREVAPELPARVLPWIAERMMPHLPLRTGDAEAARAQLARFKGESETYTMRDRPADAEVRAGPLAGKAAADLLDSGGGSGSGPKRKKRRIT